MLISTLQLARRLGRRQLPLFATASVALGLLAACGSDTAASNGAAGNTSAGANSGGTSGMPATGGTAGASAGNVGVSGGGASGGSPLAGAAGANAGAGGAIAGGATAGGNAGSAGAGGASAKCGGNAVSLSANGTGMASDAAQARVVIDLMSDTPTGAAKRPVEFWMYVQPTDWVGERNQVYYSGSTGTNTTFGLDFGTNPVKDMPTNHATLDPFTNGIYSVDSTTDLGITSASAQWVHVVMSWDGSMKTYVNGTLRITAVANSVIATGNGPFIIGCNPGNMFCFNGLFDELRIWNRALSDAEIQASYTHLLKGDEQGLVGYYKFDEQPGAAVATDSVTAPGHVAHPGTLIADAPAHNPSFVTPSPAPPLVCP